MADLGDHHRSFLQVFMLRKICEGSEVWHIYNLACTKYGITAKKNELSAFVNKINNHLRPLHMEIKKGVCEVTGAHCYALINIANNSIMKLASDYSAMELELYKKILEKIVLSDSGSISSVEALNLTNEMERKISKKEAEDVLVKFVKDHWLASKSSKEVILGTRAFIELDPFLRQTYADDVVFCHMCCQIVLQGESCSHCRIKLHYHCAKRCFEGKQQQICPKCRKVWPCN